MPVRVSVLLSVSLILGPSHNIPDDISMPYMTDMLDDQNNTKMKKRNYSSTPTYPPPTNPRNKTRESKLNLVDKTEIL